MIINRDIKYNTKGNADNTREIKLSYIIKLI